MNKVLRTSPPGWFWLVAIFLLLCNGYGVFAYLASVMTSPAAEIAVMSSAPFWATGAFAVAVFAGLAGAIGLLVKRAWARGMFILSLVAALIQQVWILFVSDWLAVSGAQALLLPLLIDLVAIAGIWFAARGIHRGWLR
ncbi:MAG: hypothetical protein ABR601_06260 [Parasphingopyxis sp.]|nr:hypothetical protein [Sphingomonadales bacterium]